MANGSTKIRNALNLQPISADPSNPEEGDIQFSDGTARPAGLWQYTSGAWAAIGGAGGGGLDSIYVESFEAVGFSDVFTTGNAASPDAAGTGTMLSTGAEETTDPLLGDQSVKLTLAASSEDDFFIYNADIPVTLGLENTTVGLNFIYTYDGSDDDIRFFVLDQDDTELTASDEYLKSTSDAKRFSTSVFIPSGTTGIRYGWQVVSSTTSAVTVIDNVQISSDPFVYKNLSNDTDSEAFTPTGAYTTNITYTGFKRRMGELLNVDAKAEFSGATDSGQFYINLPEGLEIDTDKITDVGSVQTPVGTFIINDSGTTTYGGFIATRDSTSLWLYAADGGGLSGISNGGLLTFASGDAIRCNFTVPIAGWTSTTEHLITPAKSGIESAKYQIHAGYGSSATKIPYFSVELDSSIDRLGSINNESVNGFSFTASKKVLAFVQYSQSQDGAGNPDSIGFSVNGDPTVALLSLPSNENFAPVYTDSGIGIVHTTSTSLVLEPGDILRPHTNNDTTPSITNRSEFNLIVVDFNQQILSAIPGPIAAKYESSSGFSVANATYSTVAYEDLVRDTNGAYNTSTGVYTVPESGWYSIKSSLRFVGLTAGTGVFITAVFIDGVQNESEIFPIEHSDQTASVEASNIYLEKDQEVTIRYYQDNGATRATHSADAHFNKFSVIKIGI